MNERYRRYARDRFKRWKERVASHLPNIALSFYGAKLNGCRIPQEKERLLGMVIENISNPYYSILGRNGDRLCDTGRMADEILLEIHVNELFSYVKSLTPHP